MQPIFCVIASVTLLVFPLAMKGAEPEPIEITLHPAAAPVPALKYKLLPGYLDRIPGNAAVHYGKVTAEEIPFFSNRELLERLEVWRETPIEELRKNRVQMVHLGPIEDTLRRAACCKYCDWQLPIGQEPYYLMLLPEVQQLRQFGRILATKARFEIVAGRYEDAIQTIQTGFALARNAAEGETIVNGLVGIANCGIMDEQLMAFVQQPNAPNLYWALSALPSPFIDMRTAIEVDSLGIELSLHEMRDIENAKLTPERWRELLHWLADQVKWLGDDEDAPEVSQKTLDDKCEKMLPLFRLFLTMRGMSKEEVEAMAPHQAALIYTMRLHHELVDDPIKYISFPYPDASKGIEEAIERAEEIASSGREMFPLSLHTVRAYRTARNAAVRVDRRIAFLRVLEALRLHAAETKAGLPAQLADITEVPIPDDPVTGEPFDYRLDGDTAFVTSPDIPNAEPFRYSITMKRE